MNEPDKARLRVVLGELEAAGVGSPRDKTGLARVLRQQGREAEAERIEAGGGFSLVAGEGGRAAPDGGRRHAAAQAGRRAAAGRLSGRRWRYCLGYSGVKSSWSRVYQSTAPRSTSAWASLSLRTLATMAWVLRPVRRSRSSALRRARRVSRTSAV